MRHTFSTRSPLFRFTVTLLCAIVLFSFPALKCKGVEYELNLHAGWNLVSLPIEPSDPSVGAVFGSMIIGPVLEWRHGQYVEVTHLRAGRGYWVYVGRSSDAGISITVSGSASAVSPRVFLPGWHL